MAALNRLYVTAYLGESDLRSLARSLDNMASVEDLADAAGFTHELGLEDLERCLTVLLPTDRIAGFIAVLRKNSLRFGTLDVLDRRALAVADTLDTLYVDLTDQDVR